ITLRPRFKQCFRYEVISSEGVVLLCEGGYFLLPGNVYVQLAPLLDGQHTVDEIFAHLQDEVPAAQVFRALAFLRSKGLVVDAAPSVPSEQAAFWGMAGGDFEGAIQRLQETTVSIVSFGEISLNSFQTMLASVGICVGANGERWVVLTDDYLRP